MSKELIIVKQLPIIEERLKSISEEIKRQTQEALDLACTEETVKEIKKVRTGLKQSFKELEDQRKAVKSLVLSPYEQFEAVYRTCVTDVFLPADSELKRRIDEVEDTVRAEKRTEVTAYFDEYAKSANIDFLAFDKSDIQVALSTSVKSLKTQAKKYIDRIVEELALIATQEFKEEILVEYKRSLNVAKAITSVSERHAAIEAERERLKMVVDTMRLQDEAEQKVEVLIEEESIGLEPPATIELEPEPPDMPDPLPAASEAIKVYSASFTVRGTIDQLKALKSFLVEGGYDYESI